MFRTKVARQDNITQSGTCPGRTEEKARGTDNTNQPKPDACYPILALRDIVKADYVRTRW